MSEPGGLLSHFGTLLGAKLAYLRARLQLAGIEGKEAAIHFAIILGLAAGAALIALFGYLFFVIALVFLIAWACGGGNAWIYVMFAFALGHFGTALVLLVISKAKLAQPVFQATLSELKKDQEWLKNPAKPN
ncbi:MAG TPA: phage holin family protein [Chthoniobacteraceae bacterium]|nr:phage holin family protein [Chthoniobacteraceae bacterium]